MNERTIMRKQYVSEIVKSALNSWHTHGVRSSLRLLDVAMDKRQ